MTGAVIYPSGRVYAGRHGPAILRRFGPGAARADIDAAERRAIRLARHLWAGRCVNVSEFTSADARADPDMMLRKLAQVQALNQDPDWRAEMNAKTDAAVRSEMGRALRSADSKARSATPEGQAQWHAKANTPEARAMETQQ